jgi:hypothetical protein
MIGAPGLIGALGFSRGRPAPPGAPDFTLSNSSVVTAWGRVIVGTLTPQNTADAVYFEILSDVAGIAVENG